MDGSTTDRNTCPPKEDRRGLEPVRRSGAREGGCPSCGWRHFRVTCLLAGLHGPGMGRQTHPPTGACPPKPVPAKPWRTRMAKQDGEGGCRHCGAKTAIAYTHVLNRGGHGVRSPPDAL